MEGNFSTERRRTMKNIKQCVRNIPRLKQPPENPEDTRSASINGPSWVPVRLSGDTNRGTSVLESKVKALKEKKGALNKQGELVPQERAFPKKAKTRKGKPLTEPTLRDVLVEPQSQIRTYLTDVLLDSANYLHLGQEEVQEGMLSSSYVNEVAVLKGPRAAGEATKVGRSPPKEFQRQPGRKVLEKKALSGNATRKISRNGLCGASSSKDLASDRDPFEEANGKEDHQFQALDFESSSFPHGNDTIATTGRLWRAESWDSLGSGGSNASSLSLAERVERNRAILQEMLSVSAHNGPHPSHEGHTLYWHKKETPDLGNERPSNEILANDVDWDSGVSLQDSEGFRAFVPNQELELSPRHEQAKQLLQRARMKARTNPLRASHSILPAAPHERRDACGFAVVDTRNFALKDGDSHTSGNLSDSSSGESSCGQQGKRGPSPSRVRFEDESARDAEVRYLERLQQRQKRVLDSVLLSLGQGPLASKPDLSDYINGDHQRKQNEDRQNTRPAAEELAHQSSRGRSEKGQSLVVNEEGKCSACGSYITNSLASQNPDARVNPTGNAMPQTRSIPQESKHLAQANESKELSACQEDSRTKTLGPKGTPLWILPSRQRVYTERIRETYIGEVTCIDDVDSALDSATDTSDSYRTDSEETGTNSCRTVDKNSCHCSPCSDAQIPCPSGRGRKAEWERHRENGVCSTIGEKIWDSGPRISQAEIHSTANEMCNCNSKGAPEVRGQMTKRAANGVETFPRVNQTLDQFQLIKKGKGQGHSKDQLRQPTPAICSQQVPSHLVSDSVTDSLNGKPVESSDRAAPRPTNNLSQTAQITGPSQQLAKHMAAGFNLVNRVPAPPSTGKVLSSPLLYRRVALTGSCKPASQDPGLMDSAKKLSVSSPAPNSSQGKCVSGLQEQYDTQPGPKMLSKSHLLALSTNNCNNTNAKGQPESSVTAAEENSEVRLGDIQELDKNKGPLSSSCVVHPAAPNTISSTAIAVFPTAEEADPTISTLSHSKEALKADTQKTKPVRPNIVQGKPLETYPEPNKKQFAKKAGIATFSSSSSTSGLRKFFTSLSQSTKQRLGRFRCYSMEQISAAGADTPVAPEEAGEGTTSSPKMKKAPSLQSLRLVSPFNQPRKSSSVQNLHSLFSKTDRSSLYQLGEPKDGTSVPGRKAGAHPRRSLSVEDIGSPDLVRTVGRVVEVFPDGTSQLELQRPPQGTFGFRVASGNGRPDTGIYVQEMADASTAKLYAGLLGVGDEILELNGAKVAGLGLAHINEQLLRSDTLSVRVLRQRPIRR